MTEIDITNLQKRYIHHPKKAFLLSTLYQTSRQSEFFILGVRELKLLEKETVDRAEQLLDQAYKTLLEGLVKLG